MPELRSKAQKKEVEIIIISLFGFQCVARNIEG
jgi:hypothetical protein